MRNWTLFFLLFFLFLVDRSFSQGFLITSPKLEFDGRGLAISYDLVNKNKSDQFYVWIEIVKKNGDFIQAKSLTGDIGSKIKAGNNKKIIWIPASDSVFLDEEVFVEVKAEKYIRSFNKGSTMLMSAAFPGLGQAKISDGKAWWLAGVAAYGTLGAGIIARSSSQKTFESYKTEEDISRREALFDKAQRQTNISGALIISGVALWAANILWVGLTPNDYRPLQHLSISLDHSGGPNSGTRLLTLRINF